MASLSHLDTHLAAWLFAGDLNRIPAPVRRHLQRDALTISPMVELELQFLFEIRRTTQPGAVVVRDLATRIGLTISDTPFSRVIDSAAQLTWTRDPFDRVIVGHALADGGRLLTQDATIRRHCRIALWE